MNAENPLKAVVSVSSVCRRLSMSRSQFYFHVKRGTFPAPLRLPSNQRPYYTASMVEDIVRARETGVGVNGEYVLFYERLTTTPKGIAKADHSSLLEGLRTLGLTSITTEQIDAAIAVCFPKGTAGQDEANVLRAVFRHARRETLAIYQHVALDGDLEQKYQEAMKKVDL